MAACYGRSTWSLNGMSPLLLWLARKSPLFLLATLWVALLASEVSVTVLPAWASQPLITFVTLLAVLGYPLTIVFGSPRLYSTPPTRYLAFASLAIAVVACVGTGLDASGQAATDSTFGKSLLGGVLSIILLSPLVLATRVLSNARRALGSYRPLDSIGTFLSLFYFVFGGAVFAQRRLREVVNSAAIGRGEPGTNAV
jgi:hypothetical protein